MKRDMLGHIVAFNLLLVKIVDLEKKKVRRKFAQGGFAGLQVASRSSLASCT